MKALGLVVLWLCTVAIALTGGWSVMYRVSYVVLGLGMLSWVWARIGARTLTVERRTRTHRAQVGSFFEEWIAVDNTSFLPKPWVDVRCLSELAGHGLAHGIFLGPHARRTWHFRSQCIMRGKFTIGDVVCTTGDPFGLFQGSMRFPSATTVVVYPRTVDFLVPARVPGQLPGGTRQGGAVPFVTPAAAGVRDYQPSDPYHRIHWPSTARTGRLMVKEFELDPFADVWVVLDLERRAHVGSGPESTEEYAATVAASLARHFLLENRSVGLVAQAQLLPPDRGARQMNKALEVLALVRANRPESLAETLAAQSMHFSQVSTVCIVTPSLDRSWTLASRELAHRGVKQMVVLIDASTFGDSKSPAEVLAALAAAGVPTYVVKREDPLEGLLAQPQPVGSMMHGRRPIDVA